jgi:hypothetical protein
MGYPSRRRRAIAVVLGRVTPVAPRDAKADRFGRQLIPQLWLPRGFRMNPR